MESLRVRVINAAISGRQQKIERNPRDTRETGSIEFMHMIREWVDGSEESLTNNIFNRQSSPTRDMTDESGRLSKRRYLLHLRASLGTATVARSSCAPKISFGSAKD